LDELSSWQSDEVQIYRGDDLNCLVGSG